MLDEAPRVRSAWGGDGIHALLDEVYDRIIVYGQPDIYDVVAEYDLSPCAAAKTRFVGYLCRPAGTRPRAEVQAELGMRTNRLGVVTAGGGGDGVALLWTALDAIRHEPAAATYDWLLVAGPLMAVAGVAPWRRSLC